MAKDLDLTKVSENLTPKERAKLVITLRLRGIEETKNLSLDELKEMARKQTMPTQADITKIVNACPQEQIREYNAYIELEHRVMSKVLTNIEYYLQRLDGFEGRIAPLRYAFGISPLTYHALEAVERLPHLVTKEEYEKGLERAREIRRAGVWGIEGEGNANLAEWEAYYRLKKEGKIKEESTDFIDGWISYIEKYGKTKDELIGEAVKSVKYGLEQYLKHKQRTGEEDRLWKDYKKYEGLGEKELRGAVTKNYASTDYDISERITAQPTKEEYELWHKTVKEERERILQAVKDGKLKWVKRKQREYDRETKSWKWEEVEGIESGSYYDWEDRYDKDNLQSEENIELRYIEGKGVVYVGDPSLTEEEEEKEELIAIKVWNTFSPPKEVITSFLEALLPVKVDKEKKGLLKNEDIVKLRLSTPQVEEALTGFVTKAEETIRIIQNNIALVREIEAKHFDGMSLTSQDPTNPIGTIPRALKAIEELTQRHNSHIKLIEETFNKMGGGFWEYKLERVDDFLINPDQRADQKWVEQELEDLEKEAGLNG